MKNIAIIIQKLNGGGAERVAATLSVGLSGNNNVHLIVFDGKNITYPYGGMLHDLRLPPASGAFGKTLNFVRRIKAVKQIKNRENIQAAISLMDGANLINVFSGTGDKLLTSVRINMSESRGDGIKRLLSRFILNIIEKRSDYIVAVSDGVKDDLKYNFGLDERKLVTVYNPCNAKLIKEKAMLHAAEAAVMPEMSVTSMGRLNEQKGQWHLIRAFSRVVELVPDAKLFILGEGPLVERLQTLISELSMEDNVILMDYVEAPHAYIMKSKVFVLSSLYEGMPNVLLEAMACGVPCISTDCHSGAREILAPGTEIKESLAQIEYAQFGILTSVGGKGQFDAHSELTKDELQLADAMLSVLRDTQLHDKYSQMAIIRSEDFQPEKIMAQWEKLL